MSVIQFRVYVVIFYVLLLFTNLSWGQTVISTQEILKDSSLYLNTDLLKEGILFINNNNQNI